MYIKSNSGITVYKVNAATVHSPEREKLWCFKKCEELSKQGILDRVLYNLVLS